MGSLRQLKNKYPCHGHWTPECEKTCYSVESCRDATIQSNTSCLVRQNDPHVTAPEWEGPVRKKRERPKEILVTDENYQIYREMYLKLESLGFRGQSKSIFWNTLIKFMTIKQKMGERVSIVISEEVEAMYNFGERKPDGYSMTPDGKRFPKFRLEVLESWSFSSQDFSSVPNKLLAVIVKTRKKWKKVWEV
jgi:hypothetical protein